MIRDSNIPIKRACNSLCVSRSGYYKPKQATEDTDIKVKNEIQRILREFPAYGYRRVAYELRRRKTVVNHKRVLRIMHDENWLCKKKKFKVITTNSDHNLPIFPNLAKDLEVIKPNQLWGSDITYIRLLHECVYLAAIVDIFSRKCVGWNLSRNIDTTLAMKALEEAISARQGLGFEGLIHHSDRGVQYASHDYVNRLSELGIKISMSRQGNPYDNAFMESFIKTLKAEEVYMNEYETLEEAYKNIGRFIEQVYNKKRLHSSIGYVPPEEFEEKHLKTNSS